MESSPPNHFRHDVVAEVEGKLQIIVERFRRWVLQVINQL